MIAIIALIAALAGTAWAALGKNSVGPRQLKSKSVTAAKFADRAVTTDKVAKNTITGDDIDLNQLGTVPSATNAVNAQVSEQIDSHKASCPGGTIEVRGLCFDAVSNPPVNGLLVAADSCAAKGGYLPSPALLLSVRGLIDLGSGGPESTDHQYTDSYYDNTSGVEPRTTMVNSSGPIEAGAPPKAKPLPITDSAEYICVYHLVHPAS